MRTLCSLLIAVLLLAWAPAARADEKMEEAKQAFEQAEKAYALGKFDDALKKYEHAYELAPLPGFLFNLGQCHRNLGNWERARFFYQGYLAREPKMKQPEREKVNLLIDQMSEKIKIAEEEAKAKAAAQVTPVNPPPTNPVNPPVGTNPPPTNPPNGTTPDAHPANPPDGRLVPIVPPTQPPPVEATPTYKKPWVWVVVGVVVLGAAAGGIAAAALNPSVSTSKLDGSLGSPINGH